ncbi:MAG: DUF1553 domain-containing protein [Terracidiphilus sp.]|jgi:hypothetical protein
MVNTVDNFDSMCDQPSNQQLLDYLALESIRNGWSTKKLVPEIIFTRAYRLGAEVPAGYPDIDPVDRYIWRHAPRRLEAEEIRDSILASSGQLDLNHPHGSPSMNLRMIEVFDDGPVVKSILNAADALRYRSIYLPQLRGEVPRPLATFDPVTQTFVTGQRNEATVPTQALFMLNSPFVREQSLKFADTLIATKYSTSEDRIRYAYERVLSRDPRPQEILRAKAFLSRYSAIWLKTQPGSPVADKPRVARASAITTDITAARMIQTTPPNRQQKKRRIPYIQRMLNKPHGPLSCKRCTAPLNSNSFDNIHVSERSWRNRICLNKIHSSHRAVTFCALPAQALATLH